MLKFNLEDLTDLEIKISEILSEAVSKDKNLKIVDAAILCDVSPSKISKLVRKLGFKNFKHYRLYYSGQQDQIKTQKRSNEIERLISILENYDEKLVDDFIDVYQDFNKIILYGLGPSFIAADYFLYKLSTISEKNIFVTQHEDYAERIADKDTLLIVFSVTGKFASFDNLFRSMHNTQATTMLILEENINTSNSSADYILFLSKYAQSDDLLAFEKTRTVFFIFIEEIISKLKLINENKLE